MEFREVLQNRRSVRCFNDQPIEHTNMLGLHETFMTIMIAMITTSIIIKIKDLIE